MRVVSSKIAAWMQIEENREAYKKWRTDPTTVAVINMLREEASPIQLPIDGNGRVQIETSPHFHGQQIGEERILERILNLDYDMNIPSDIIEKYDQKAYLMSSGYTEEDADRIIEENSDAE